MARWTALQEAERPDFFTEHGVRATPFARLPYFNVVRCLVLEPMHVGLQGEAKNQWYSRWIRNNIIHAPTNTRLRELGQIHEFLRTVSNLSSPAGS